MTDTSKTPSQSPSVDNQNDNEMLGTIKKIGYAGLRLAASLIKVGPGIIKKIAYAGVVVVLYILGIGLVINLPGLVLMAYDGMESIGLIPHDRTLNVYMGSNWLIGENRTCSLTFEYDSNKKELTDKLYGLVCPIGDERLEPHNITVTFKGATSHTSRFGNKVTVANEWRCTRSSDRFTCEAIDSGSN